MNAAVVVDGDIDSALKKLRKKIEKEGLIKEIKKGNVLREADPKAQEEVA